MFGHQNLCEFILSTLQPAAVWVGVFFCVYRQVIAMRLAAIWTGGETALLHSQRKGE